MTYCEIHNIPKNIEIFTNREICLKCNLEEIRKALNKRQGGLKNDTT